MSIQLCEEGLAQAEKGFGQCGMLFLDLDGFKPINDTYGHSKGDALLKAVAGRLVNAVAGYGQVGRIGGDEFAVVLPNIRSEEHTSELPSLMRISYSVFCLKKKKIKQTHNA